MSQIAGILLAAGSGRRIGHPKALLRWGGETFVSRLAKTWAAVCDPVIVVGGASFAQVKEQLPPAAVAVFNPRFDGPMITSVQTGVGAAPSAEAAIVGPVDQPLQDAGLLLDLVAAWRETPDRIVIPTHQGQSGHPAIVPRRFFGSIAQEPDWSTLEKFFERHADDVRRLELPTRPEVLRNINTPDEYRVFMTAAIEDEQSTL